MKTFEEYLLLKIMKKQTPNRERAASLLEEAQKKKQFLNISLQRIPEADMNPNFIVDSCYDIMIELIRSKLHMDGYNAGTSHEAEISYMEKIGFSTNEMRTMDELRYYRNGTKYYGTMLSKEYADKTLRFMRSIYPKLEKLVK